MISIKKLCILHGVAFICAIASTSASTIYDVKDLHLRVPVSCVGSDADLITLDFDVSPPDPLVFITGPDWAVTAQSATFQGMVFVSDQDALQFKAGITEVSIGGRNGAIGHILTMQRKDICSGQLNVIYKLENKKANVSLNFTSVLLSSEKLGEKASFGDGLTSDTRKSVAQYAGKSFVDHLGPGLRWFAKREAARDKGEVPSNSSAESLCPSCSMETSTKMELALLSVLASWPAELAIVDDETSLASWPGPIEISKTAIVVGVGESRIIFGRVPTPLVPLKNAVFIQQISRPGYLVVWDMTKDPDPFFSILHSPEKP